ncbi:MAG: hypothetical protein NZ846_00820 [Thermus sp.]|uniref:hypothetical protein n=1 Tax=Thermus sp. TaxID=275 RepID=UPI0025FB2377|nr:hypothetical protein [Thermus sp.]MCS7217518.1 hypothetical protein [Thermus sp.]
MFPTRFLLALGFLSGWAWAWEVWAPLPGAFLLPLGGVPAPQGCRLHLGLALANHLSYAAGPWGEMGFDLEEVRAELGVGYGEGSWRLQAFFPFSLFHGGVTDYLLDPLHALLGLPHNRIQGQVLLFARRGGAERRWEGPTLGPRDPYLRLGLDWEAGEVFGALALPLGPVERFLGAGGFRLLLGGGWRWPGGEALAGALWPLGPQPGLEPFPYGPALLALVRWEGLWGGPWALEVQGFLGPLRDAGPFAHGLALRLSYGVLAFGEDGTPGMPDVVLAWRGSLSLPCP